MRCGSGEERRVCKEVDSESAFHFGDKHHKK